MCPVSIENGGTSQGSPSRIDRSVADDANMPLGLIVWRRIRIIKIKFPEFDGRTRSKLSDYPAAKTSNFFEADRRRERAEWMDYSRVMDWHANAKVLDAQP